MENDRLTYWIIGDGQQIGNKISVLWLLHDWFLTASWFLHLQSSVYEINKLRPKGNGRHFVDIL